MIFENQSLKEPQIVCVGVIVAPQGVRGEVRVKSFMEKPQDLIHLKTCLMGNDLKVTRIIRAKPLKADLCVLTLENLTERNGAEALKGKKLFVPKGDLPELDEDRFYHEDLVGLMALTDQGKTIGQVIAVHNFGASDILEIKDSKDHTIMVPFTKDRVPQIDLKAKRLIVDGTYLLDLAADEPDAQG